jgi:hypothetical protein
MADVLSARTLRRNSALICLNSFARTLKKSGTGIFSLTNHVAKISFRFACANKFA